MSRPFVSVIIPVWRDVAPAARAAVSAVGDGIEIIAVAAWEDADAVASAAPFDPVQWLFARRGRGNQMNTGAAAATGEWLLFLHADSELPVGWLSEIHAAAAHGCAAGCFRFGIAAAGWRPRAWEWLVRVRVALVSLPYGDQAIFVRRDLFVALGGYRDMPLMEDVDFVQRVRRRTRLWKASPRVLTSARRWERDGWFWRSAANLTLMLRYQLGADPRALARVYQRHHAAVVAVLGRAPSAPGKTRLGPSDADLRRALLLDTWDAVTSGEWDQALVFTPMETAPECAALVTASTAPPLLVPQRGGDLGDRMSAAFEDLFAAGYLHVILIGSDLPSLPAAYLRDAIQALARGAEVTLGAAEDGGFYLIGLSAPHREIFSGIRWSGSEVLEQTQARAQAAGLRVSTVPTWYDVDAPADLQRLSSADSSRAVRTRRLIAP